MERERIGTRLGFILISAGSAIGIGNVWKFPYITGISGGGIFVLIYLFFLISLGIPIMVMEFSAGRASRKSPIKMYDEILKKKTMWNVWGYVSLIGSIIIMMFYTTVTGWMFKYFVDTAKGEFINIPKEEIGGMFVKMLDNPVEMIIYMVLVVGIGFLICSLGLKTGLERFVKFMMLALGVIMLILVINSLTLSGAKEGLRFYLFPDISKVKKEGFLEIVIAAMNQAFFSLGIGIGAMAIFGSYIDTKHSLLKEASTIVFLDTLVAIIAGLIIFPACFTYNVEVDAGPSLIFITLPNIFANMKFGRIFGTLFFVFMSFAAFSTVIAVFENIIGIFIELLGISRKKASVLGFVLISVLSLPCILGFNILKHIQPLGSGTNILELEDFIVSSVLLPLGALSYVVFCVTKYGWGFEGFINEANKGSGIKIGKWTKYYMKYVLPLILLFIFVMGIKKFI